MDTRNRYNDRWHEDGLRYRYRDRRANRHFERDQRRLACY